MIATSLISLTLKLCFLLAVGLLTGALLGAVWRSRARCTQWFASQREELAGLLDRAGVRHDAHIIWLLLFGGPLTKALIRFLIQRRCSHADVQLPDALTLIGNGLGAGLSLQQAIGVASEHLPDPLGGELRRVSEALHRGETIEEALGGCGKRLPTEDLALMIQTVEVLRRTGGNLIESFATLARTIEDRRHVAERMRALTMQGIAQGVILFLLPWFMLLLLAILAPAFIRPLWETELGRKILLLALGWESLGALWMRWVVRVRL